MHNSNNCVLLVILYIVSTVCSTPTCPSSPPCPKECTAGKDTQGCQTCDCKGKATPAVPHCPSSMMGIGPCPMKCTIGLNSDGCRACICPPGVKANEHECSPDKKCPYPNSDCMNGYCFCNGEYDRTKKGCVKRPALGEQCFVDGEYVTCTGYGVDVNCDRNSTQHKCTCNSGFEPNGDKKECKHKERKLNDQCDSDSDCATAYTYCTKGKCKCIDGFVENNTVCSPKSYNCPKGDPASKNGQVVFCEVKYNPKTFTNDIDTCPKDYSCFTPPDVFSKDRNYLGHCCPKTKPNDKVGNVCPVGNIHPTGKCPDSSQPVDGPLLPQFQPFCPMESHECVQQRCCPRPCRRNITGFFSVDNHCYDHLVLNQECDVSAQCNTNADCVQGKDKKKKTCQCKSGYKERDSLFCEKVNPSSGS